MGWVAWQKTASELYFWVRYCARNCPLEILSSPHSHFLDEITEIKRRSNFFKTVKRPDMFSWLLIQPHLFLHSSEVLPGVQDEPVTLGPLGKGCQEGPGHQDGLGHLCAHPEARSVTFALNQYGSIEQLSSIQGHGVGGRVHRSEEEMSGWCCPTGRPWAGAGAWCSRSNKLSSQLCCWCWVALGKSCFATDGEALTAYDFQNQPDLSLEQPKCKPCRLSLHHSCS